MSRSGFDTVVRAAAVTLLAAGAAACDITLGAHEYRVREEKKFAVTGAARVNLSTFDGSVEIRGWDRPEVLIEIEKVGPDQGAADAITVAAKQEGGVITIDIPRPPGLSTDGHWRTSPGASIIASVPLQADLVVRSGDGSVQVRRVDGTFDLRTEDGSVKLVDVKGRLLVRTGDGSIRGDGLEGSVDAETGDGSVVLDGALKGVRIDTNDGSIQLTARDGSRMADDWLLSTGDGSIRAELPKGFAAEVDAESGDGRVHVEGLTKDEGRDTRDGERTERRARRSARGTLGDGGKTLKLRSGDGSITVQVW
jgi:DUF4097 and DUF4098 domain-containing protein YvlB